LVLYLNWLSLRRILESLMFWCRKDAWWKQFSPSNSEITMYSSFPVLNCFFSLFISSIRSSKLPKRIEWEYGKYIVLFWLFDILNCIDSLAFFIISSFDLILLSQSSIVMTKKHSPDFSMNYSSYISIIVLDWLSRMACAFFLSSSSSGFFLASKLMNLIASRRNFLILYPENMRLKWP